MYESRMDKYDKRRKNTKLLNLFILIGALLIIVLLLIFFIKKDDHNAENNNLPLAGNNEENTEQNEEGHENEHHNNESINNDTEENNDQTSKSENENREENVQETGGEIITLPLEDSNVISAYTKNWSPIGTSQDEPHETQFNKETQDWLEMEQALKIATELDEIIIWWLTNDGPNRAIGTVTSMDQTEIYRVYISWVPYEGWQPTKVEVLMENDKHPDYESDEEE